MAEKGRSLPACASPNMARGPRLSRARELTPQTGWGLKDASGAVRGTQSQTDRRQGGAKARQLCEHLSLEPRRGRLRAPARQGTQGRRGQGEASRQGLAAGRSHSKASAQDSGTTGLVQLLREGKRWAEKQGSLGAGGREGGALSWPGKSRGWRKLWKGCGRETDRRSKWK